MEDNKKKEETKEKKNKKKEVKEDSPKEDSPKEESSPKDDTKQNKNQKKKKNKKDDEDFKAIRELGHKKTFKLTNLRRVLNFGFALLTTLISICFIFLIFRFISICIKYGARRI
jgi:hypothetical protein